MSSSVTKSISLSYGDENRLTCQLDDERIVATHCAPEPVEDVRQAVRTAIENPLDFPPLEQALVPGDHIAIALDSHTPQAAAILAEVWAVFERRQIDPANVVIVQPRSESGAELIDPRSELPAEIRERVNWKIHDPADESDRAYLASSSISDRIYLARSVIEADFVLPIGQIAFDSLLGYRGTGSVFYPGLSTDDAYKQTRGQGHAELGPDDERTLRQVIDEICWLMGVQFTIQTIASSGTGVSHVLAGACDSVLRQGKSKLAQQWTVEVDCRPDIVVAGVDSDAAGHGWEQIGRALELARNLVVQDGKIIILSELDTELGEGLNMIRSSESPRDAIKPLRLEMPTDLVPATQLANANDWATVYLLSRMDGDLIEDLFIVPVDNEAEINRLLQGDGSCVFLESAQNTYGRVV